MSDRVQSSVYPGLASGLALIFDMDGVVVNSNVAHRDAWVAFNRRFGLETTDAMFLRMYGKRNDEILRDYYGNALSPEEIVARGAAKEEIYRQIMAGHVEDLLVPGLKHFLERHRGVPMAVASNAETENVRFVLEEASLAQYFRAVLDGSQVQNAKPHPEIYLRAAEALGVPPANCIVFEDSYSGVSAACAAGMRVIGIRTTHPELPGTEIAVDDFRSEELESWLGVQNPA